MTTTKNETLRSVLNDSNLNEIDAALGKAKFGNMLSEVKVVVAGLTAAAAIDITTAAVKAAATITGLELASGENLPAVGVVKSLRVSASGTAASLGSYIASDPGATAIIPPGGASAAVGVALLSDDGKTITFPNTVTGFVLTYRPRAAVDMGSLYAAMT
jgi:hypothetical protein